MEDILHSIRQIITEDEPGAKKDAPPVSGSSILELTEIVAEEPSSPPPATEEKPMDTVDIDKLFEQTPAPATAPAPDIKPPTELPPEQPAMVAPPVTPVPTGETLLSDMATKQATDALKPVMQNLSRSDKVFNLESPGFRSGNTVEGLVQELLRPMLKEWLDDNLPKLVERIVEKEVKRIIALNSN